MNITRISAVAMLAFALAAGQMTLSTPAFAGENGTQANTGKPDPAQFARGAKAWSENCGRCHNLRDPKEFSDKNWHIIVNHMRTLAPLPGGMARDIRAFLERSN